MYDDRNFFHFPFLVYSERPVKNQSYLRTNENMEEKKKCASNKKLIWG